MKTTAPSSAEAASASASATLARFVADHPWQDVPERVRHAACRALLNFFAAALSAARTPTIDAALRTFSRFSGPSQASLAGRAERVDMPTAAALNAMAANLYDFDDTHHPTIIHPTSPIAPALFALAETRPLSGQQLLHAFVLGVEAACRIGNAISPEHYARGWHITSTCGVFGAALASARCLGLDAARNVHVIGAAAVQAGGLVETLGTAVKSISVGNAARNGLLSALLVQEGLDGPAQPLEGERGFLRVVGEAPRLGEVTEGLGERWELLKNAYKPYPCGVVLNPVIDACLELAQAPAVAEGGWRRIASIELRGHPLLRQRTDRPSISSGRQSQVCAQHAVAVSLVRGRAGLAEFSDEAVADPDLRALGSRVVFQDDAAMSVDAVQVRIDFPDGQVLRREISTPRGSLARPLEDHEIEQKLRELNRYGGAGIDADRLIEAVWSLERAPDASLPMRMAARAERAEGEERHP
ncbi:MmgE/PrpD family protein [Achromobacter aloeverae]|uniref:MmgE/PrpD family protein n=1 Tax=Achromobacter aloeverae TaxID=1750518 RepID=A0A4Q1HFJ4_9BURK|nr:MmgE/PrpD family protein [Achromobacter aloeverae]RXN85475.1 MmgE/PrpD family protein [Achromobacter aloeverae]